MRLIDADSFERDLKEKLLPLLVEKYGKEEAMKGLHFSLQDCISNIQGQPTITQPEQRWIPVTESLPEDGQLVIFSTKTGRVHQGKYYGDNSMNQWYSAFDKMRAWNNVVNAWMPLPEPYREGELMSDLISRQAAIDALDEIEAEVADGYGYQYAKWREYFVEMAPAQPEIIHCRECEYGEKDDSGRYFCRDLCCQMGDVWGNGFCSDAERKTDE